MEQFQNTKLQIINMKFHGPFKFSKNGNYLFDSNFESLEGIYIWTIKDEFNRINYVHYIGETTNYKKRNREHFLSLLGMNYMVIDPKSAKVGELDIIWNGIWRDKTQNAANNALENYNYVSKYLLEYIDIINIYFAPLKVEKKLRKHIEGEIAHNLKSKFPELCRFYPSDSRTYRSSEKYGIRLHLDFDEKIDGIESTIEM